MTTLSTDAPATGASEATDRGQPVVILCADEASRDVIAYWLGCAGNAVVADDGYHAARLLEQGGRWLVTDRVLPPWPGLGTFLELHGRYPQLRIAFIESGSRDERILARVTGANVLLPKPLTRQAVSAALAQTDAHA